MPSATAMNSPQQRGFLRRVIAAQRGERGPMQTRLGDVGAPYFLSPSLPSPSPPSSNLSRTYPVV